MTAERVADDMHGSTGGNGRAERRLRVLLCLGGGIATAAGIHTLIAGAKSFPPWREADAMRESELRFYAAYYVAYGASMFRTAARRDVDPAAVNAISAALLLAALGRAGAWLMVGKPHPFQRALLAVELALPPLLSLESTRLRASTD